MLPAHIFTLSFLFPLPVIVFLALELKLSLEGGNLDLEFVLFGGEFSNSRLKVIVGELLIKAMVTSF